MAPSRDRRDIGWVMSQENVEFVRRAHEHFAKTGEPGQGRIDADTEVFDHDIADARNPYRGMAGAESG